LTEARVRRGRGPSPQKTAETQARICSAALSRFLSDGFEQTRMLDVAREAGVAKGTLYLYFPTKEALFEGILIQLLGGAVQRFAVDPPGADEPTLDFVMRAMMPLVEDEQAQLRQDLFRLIMTEGQRFPEVLAAYRKVALDPVLAAARRIGARARARGEISSDALERLPILLLAPGMLVTIWNRMFPGEALEPGDVFRSYLELLFDCEDASVPRE
jgi:TetR/AcrR family transcriptional regulator, regulator of autoinduction and epiphytic fitness